MKIPKFKFVILLLFLFALIVPALTFAQDEDGDGDGEEDILNEEYPCNTLVLGILAEMGRPDDCEYFMSLGVGPGQFKQAWWLLNMIDPMPSPETFETAMEELLAYKADGFGWGQVKHAVNYSSDGVPISTILNEWRSGEDPVGWGQIKQAKALSESDIGYEGSYEDTVNALKELGWGELKTELGYTGPPPWAKGGGKHMEDLQETGDEGKDFDGANGGPPYGKAKGHGKNKDKGK
ncbi:MAG: hypothetical protein BMS9Abin02_0238 [Anaerolineae bacterium]|nr:MAG: hypothetical protein BMS9Abin02_0238 [Anaerolineae bacterium]